MSILTKSRHVMDFIWQVDDRAMFSYGDEDDPSYFHIDAQSWEDMNKPLSITVTVEPGDLLNGNRVTD